MRQNSDTFLYLLLGSLTAFGPLVTDMYLPALPAMTECFHTSMPMVQLGLTFSMIGLAAGQLLFGPLSDKYGRRPLLLVSMAVFILSTIGCIFSPTIHWFVALRLLQGIGASGGIVISRSVAADKFSGRELAKAMAIIGAINGIAPVAAPVAGGFFTDIIGWQGIFIILLCIGFILLAAEVAYRETLPAARRSDEGLKRLALNFGKVLGNKKFLFYVLQFGCASGVLFGNIASSPFIMQQHYGFSPLVFSAFFAVNSVAIGIAAALSVKFRRTESATFYGSLLMVLGIRDAAVCHTLLAWADIYVDHHACHESCARQCRHGFSRVRSRGICFWRTCVAVGRAWRYADNHRNSVSRRKPALVLLRRICHKKVSRLASVECAA